MNSTLANFETERWKWL